MAPRQTYISQLNQVIKELFFDFSRSKNKDEIWYEHENMPLKWNLPTGVLHDFYNTSNQLPWKIIVHFSNFPSEKIFKISQIDDIQWNFINTLKETYFMKFGTAKPIMLLSKNDQYELWRSIEETDLNKYLNNEKKLKEELFLKKHPIRIFINDNRFSTLYYILPKDDLTLKEFIEYKFRDLDFKNNQILIQGIFPSLDTPMNWLCNYCSHPDGFLYIIVKLI